MEAFFYVLIWASGVLYALWSFCKSSYDIQYMLDPSDFEKGWTFWKRKKDVSDFEWAVFTSAFKIFWWLLFIQVFSTQCVLQKNKKLQLYFYTIYPVSCLIFLFEAQVAAMYIFYILLMCAVHSTGSKILSYGVTMSSFYLFHHTAFKEFRESIVPEPREGFLIDVGLIWLAARSLSFAVDRIESRSHCKFGENDFLHIFSYCLYLPVIFSGPLLDYETFVKEVTNKKKWAIQSFLETLLLFRKPVCGYFILEFLLHFVYSSAIQYYPDLLTEFDAWSICGLGYALPLLFYMKYFVIYSLCATIAALEHIEFPPPPKCISRMHVPSLLWRNFDRGLYLWILKYLYLPIMKGRSYFGRKLSALAVCFLFISLWHGKDEAICVWAALNFLGVAIETFISFTLSTNVFKMHKKSLSAHGQRSLNALISTPQFMMMCISSICFLSNVEVGYLVFKRIMLGGIVPLIPTAAIMYCGCHVSLLVKKHEGKSFKIS